MKKKILKIFAIILLILLVLFALNCLRNYTIIKDIYTKNNGYLNNLSNFHNKTIIKFLENNITQEHELWYKDGIYLSTTTQNNEKKSFIWENINTKEFFGGEYLEDGTFQEFSKEQFEEFNPKETDTYLKILFDSSETFAGVFKANIFRFIISEGNCYIINTPYFQKNVNKNSGLIESIRNVKKNTRYTETTVIFEENVVTDENITKPSI